MSAEIHVYCDSPRHARGKVAAIDQFVRVDSRWHSRGSLRKRRGAHAGPGFADDLRCKLCGQSMPKPTDAVLNTIAAQGMSRISLLELRGSSLR